MESNVIILTFISYAISNTWPDTAPATLPTASMEPPDGLNRAKWLGELSAKSEVQHGRIILKCRCVYVYIYVYICVYIYIYMQQDSK